MRRAWILVFVVVFAGIARATPPDDYQCKPGTTRSGVGCTCPAGYQDRRAGDNTAICYARSPIAPKPTKPSTPTRSTFSRTPFKLTATPIALAAKPGPAPDRCAQLEAAGRASAASTATTIPDKVSSAVAVVAEWNRSKSTTCRDGAAALVGELARWTHAQGALDDAETLYRLYLGTFSALPAAPEHAYYLAELLWTRAETQKTTTAWELAAVAFTDAARTGKLTTSLAREATHAAILAWRNANKAERAAKGPAPLKTGATTVKPISTKDLKRIATFDVYIANVAPTDDELPEIKFLKAGVYREYNHHDEALVIYREILKHHPDSDVAGPSASLALGSLNHLQRFTEMLALTDELLANASFLANKLRLRETLIKLKREGLAQRAIKLEAAGTPTKAVECGNAFIEQYNVDPLASDGDMALYNAMICFEKGSAWATSLKVFAVFEHHFSTSKLFPKVKAMAVTAKTKLGN